MDNIFEKISLTLILLKIFDIYFFCYLATNEEIATVEPLLSDPFGRVKIGSDNRKVV